MRANQKDARFFLNSFTIFLNSECRIEEETHDQEHLLHASVSSSNQAAQDKGPDISVAKHDEKASVSRSLANSCIAETSLTCVEKTAGLEANLIPLFEKLGKRGFKDMMQKEAFTWMQQQREHCCVIMPTGSGKSLLFQLSALQDDCCNMVFCPLALLSLQVLKLKESTSLVVMSWNDIVTQGISSAASACNLLIMPFEMASSDSRIIFFLQQLRQLNRLGRVFVDEAHALIEDAHYRNFDAFWTLAGNAETLCQYVVTTATLRPCLVDIMAAKLGVEKLSVFRTEMPKRPNLTFKLHKVQTQSAGTLTLQQILQETQCGAGRIIIFVQTIIESETIGDWLRENACPSWITYHSGILDKSSRFADFMKSGKMIATTCAGDFLGFQQIFCLFVAVECFFTWSTLFYKQRAKCVRVCFLSHDFVFSLANFHEQYYQ
jgi:superfamily II DNA helicase RecQ